MNIIHINNIRDCMFLNVLTAKFSSNDASGAKFANLLGEQSAAEWREFGNQMQWASSSHGSPVSYSSVSRDTPEQLTGEPTIERAAT